VTTIYYRNTEIESKSVIETRGCPGWGWILLQGWVAHKTGKGSWCL